MINWIIKQKRGKRFLITAEFSIGENNFKEALNCFYSGNFSEALKQAKKQLTDVYLLTKEQYR